MDSKLCASYISEIVIYHVQLARLFKRVIHMKCRISVTVVVFTNCALSPSYYVMVRDYVYMVIGYALLLKVTVMLCLKSDNSGKSNLRHYVIIVSLGFAKSVRRPRAFKTPYSIHISKLFLFIT